jgi:hypothetical protein
MIKIHFIPLKEMKTRMNQPAARGDVDPSHSWMSEKD